MDFQETEQEAPIQNSEEQKAPEPNFQMFWQMIKDIEEIKKNEARKDVYQRVRDYLQDKKDYEVLDDDRVFIYPETFKTDKNSRKRSQSMIPGMIYSEQQYNKSLPKKANNDRILPGNSMGNDAHMQTSSGTKKKSQSMPPSNKPKYIYGPELGPSKRILGGKLKVLTKEE